MGITNTNKWYKVTHVAIIKQPRLSYLLWITTLYSTMKLQSTLYMFLIISSDRTVDLSQTEHIYKHSLSYCSIVVKYTNKSTTV